VTKVFVVSADFFKNKHNTKYVCRRRNATVEFSILRLWTYRSSYNAVQKLRHFVFVAITLVNHFNILQSEIYFLHLP